MDKQIFFTNKNTNNSRKEKINGIPNICSFSVAKSCLTLCDPMDCSTPDFPVLHYVPEFAQTHVH